MMWVVEERRMLIDDGNEVVKPFVGFCWLLSTNNKDILAIACYSWSVSVIFVWFWVSLGGVS